MVIKAVDIRDVDFTPYGWYFDMTGQSGEGTALNTGPDFSDCCTANPVIDTPASIGYTVSGPVPFTAVQMERHAHTQEAQMCESQPIVFLVAPRTEGDRPDARDVKAILLPKGYIAVIDRHVWHSASHPLLEKGGYYWVGYAYEGDPTLWSDIGGGPVTVEMP